MKHSLTAFATWAIMMSCAMAQNFGVSMAFFDDLFLTNLREAIAAKAKEASVNVQFEDPGRYRQAAQPDTKFHCQEG
jgi:inositol transport system substrate-binding protein